jgi:hypothetical protein
LSTGEAFIRHQSRHGDLDPLFSPAFVTGCTAGHRHTPPSLWAHNPCPRRDMSLAEASRAAIGGVAEHGQMTERSQRPAFRDGTPSWLSCRAISPMLHPATVIHLVHAPHHTGLAFLDNIGGGCLVRLAHVTVSIRSVAQHADAAIQSQRLSPAGRMGYRASGSHLSGQRVAHRARWNRPVLRRVLRRSTCHRPQSLRPKKYRDPTEMQTDTLPTALAHTSHTSRQALSVRRFPCLDKICTQLS